MLPLATNHRWLLALSCALVLSWAPPAFAQLGIGVDLGGVDVDVEVGGDSGIGLDVDLGDEDTGLEVNLGGSGSEGTSSTGTGLDQSLDILTLTQDQASTAVRDRKALPLEEILLRAQLLIDGDIIDAQLIAVQDVLLYELKVLSKAGDVSELYFYARSGLPVDTN